MISNCRSSRRVLHCLVFVLIAFSTTSCTESDPYSGITKRDSQATSNTIPTSVTDGGIGPDAILCADDCSKLDGACVRGACGEDGLCYTTNLAEGFSCDDDNLCTTDDICVQGACIGDAKSCVETSCLGSSCDEDTGECKDEVKPDGMQCDTGDKCLIGECMDAICIPQIDLDCSAIATDQCTVALCDSALGCIAAPVQNATCDDGDPCTYNDRCDGQGGCSGSTLDCMAQAGPCRSGVCEAATGSCKFTDVANGTTCDDNSVCTESDMCTDGVCAGPLVDCGADQCNRAACDPIAGCSLTAQIGAPCDDADICTGPDTCDAAGKCVGILVPNPPIACP